MVVMVIMVVMVMVDEVVKDISVAAEAAADGIRITTKVDTLVLVEAEVPPMQVVSQVHR